MPRLALLTAIVAGAAIPLLPLGIAVTQGMLGLALIFALAGLVGAPEVRRVYVEIAFKPLTLALALMFAVWFMTVPWSNGPWDSFTTALRTAIYMIGCAVFWAHWRYRPGMLDLSMKAFIIFTLLALMWGSLSNTFPQALWPYVQSLNGTINQPDRYFKAFASALACMIPVLIWGGYRLRRPWQWMSWASVPAALYLMTMTGSRSSVAGILILMIVVTFSLTTANMRYAKWVLPAVILAVPIGLFWIWQQRFEPLVVKGMELVVEGTYLPTWLVDPHRQLIWRFTFEQFLQAPWTGQGINRINYVPGAGTFIESVGGFLISSHPHNWLLEILAETGIFGFLAALTAFILLMWRMMADYVFRQDPATLGLIALTAAFLGSSLFNFSIWSTWWLLTYFTLFAMLSSARRLPSHGQNRPRILFVVTEDWAFCSHRIPSAQAAREAGFDVYVTARENQHRQKIEGLGFTFEPWNIRRKSLNPFHEITALVGLVHVFDRIRPTIAYNVTFKPILYGTLAARFTDTPGTVNLFAGLGAWFISPRPLLRLIRAIVLPFVGYLQLHPGTWLMVQNSDDKTELLKLGVAPAKRTVLVPGSGIDIKEFPALPEPEGPLTAVLLSRMLWDKGIHEAVEAARLLKQEGHNVRVVLVGDPDTENPNHVPAQQLRAWHDEGVVEWWGRRDDVHEVWSQAHVALLPSYYREGIPRSLLEGAASMRPMIGADSPGCRDLVKDRENGFLVPPKDPRAIANALAQLDDDAELRRKMGRKARVNVEQTYSAHAVGEQIKRCLGDIMAGVPT